MIPSAFLLIASLGGQSTAIAAPLRPRAPASLAQSITSSLPKEDSLIETSAGLESSGFLYRSKNRGTASTTLEASIHGVKTAPRFHAEGDLTLYTFLNNTPAFGAESKQLYLETRKGALGGLQLSFGRKIQAWSKLDGTWRMMGLWSPRWTWDEMHPEVIGMTGLFAGVDSPHFKLTIYASPIAIPERGTPVGESDHQITSSNPLWRPLPTELKILGTQTKIQYALDLPPLQQILLRPNFAVQGRFQSDSGAYLTLNAGILPVNSTPLAAEPYISAGGASGTLKVDIHPEFPMRSIASIESGIAPKNGSFEAWASISHERPFHFDNRDTWLNPVIAPASIASIGGSLKASRALTLDAAILVVNEDSVTRSSQLPDINVQLPSRFPIKRALRAGLKWKITDDWTSNADWTDDLGRKNHLASFDLSRVFRDSRLTLGAGMDLVMAGSTEGWIGQFYGNDRVRGWLKYAF